MATRFLIFLLVAALASVTSSKATIRQGAEFKLEDTSEGSAEGFGIEIETLSELEEFGDGLMKPDLCFFVHQENGSYTWKCEDRGYPDNSLKDVDLLGTIGNPLPIGVSLTKGPYTKPAFHFRSGANVGRFARYIFPKGFFKEFSISVVIRPKSAERGVVFALLPHIRRGNVILGLEIHRDSFSEGTTISLIHANNGNTRTVFDFTVPSLTGKWTWLSFSIRNNGVTFYKDCREVDTKFLPAALGNFTLRPYSALYIGRAGWTPGASSSAFQGDIAELSMHRDPNKAQHQECKILTTTRPPVISTTLAKPLQAHPPSLRSNASIPKVSTNSSSIVDYLSTTKRPTVRKATEGSDQTISGGEEVTRAALTSVNSFSTTVRPTLRDITEGNDLITSGGEEGTEEVSTVDLVHFTERTTLRKATEGRDQTTKILTEDTDSISNGRTELLTQSTLKTTNEVTTETSPKEDTTTSTKPVTVSVSSSAPGITTLEDNGAATKTESTSGTQPLVTETSVPATSLPKGTTDAATEASTDSVEGKSTPGQEDPLKSQKQIENRFQQQQRQHP
ncbi:collagen alpha-1(XV) chain-like isoform X1 [Pocillopora verrucosa]|uniref:collagen alpha-1(XV) chain-like isoform X1 n=2 Tax=Pocillopora verrucosa TaxID=203993 RepID=UPI003340C058